MMPASHLSSRAAAIFRLARRSPSVSMPGRSGVSGSNLVSHVRKTFREDFCGISALPIWRKQQSFVARQRRWGWLRKNSSWAGPEVELAFSKNEQSLRMPKVRPQPLATNELNCLNVFGEGQEILSGKNFIATPFMQ